MASKYKHVQIFWLLLAVMLPLRLTAQDVPFSKGINLTGWFQVSSPGQIQFTRYTKKDFEQIKSLGCDVIRLPINLHSMTDGAPDYLLDPLFLEFLDQAVDWAEELEIHLILDNHTFDVSANTDPEIGIVLEKVWSQMAVHFKERSSFLYYEILNEPHGIDDALWNDIQQGVVQKIREIDATHTIVIGPASWNSFHNLSAMPLYEDDNLIYTFHFYDPFVFTHQGASWVEPSMAPLAGVPFPYEQESMPAFPPELQGSWIQSAFDDYSNTGTVTSVKSLIDIAVQFRDSRSVKVYCGEYGVYIPNSNTVDRVAWYDTVRTYLEANDIPWTTWDYHGGFGIFESGGNNLFDYDLNIPLLEAMGLNTPPQSEYLKMPDSTGFLMYTDFIGELIFESGTTEGTMNLYSQDLPNNDSYCISWEDPTQYNTIGFDFQLEKDLSELVSEGYALDFMVRGDTPGFLFDVRFLDSKTTDPNDHPWRIRYTIDESLISYDRKWHHVHIPLSEFEEQGAWDDQWFPAEGKFDWKAIDRFEIVTEHGALENGKLWFDNVYVTNMDTARIFQEEVITSIGGEDELYDGITVYPNPVKDLLVIRVGTPHRYRLQLMDARGKTLQTKYYNSSVEIDLSRLSSGIYLLNIVADSGRTFSRKILKD